MSKYPELKKLKGRMVEMGETYRSMSDKTEISLNTLNNKLNGHTLFDISEVACICSILKIKPTEIPVFFNQNIT